VFLPESSVVADDPVFWFKLAFALPFADLPETMQRIVQFKTTDEFVEFARSCREDIYFLVDGPDRLERELKNVISAMTSSHFYVYTAYACSTTACEAVPIRIPSALTPVSSLALIQAIFSNIFRAR
jgi:hypothetical protein